MISDGGGTKACIVVVSGSTAPPDLAAAYDAGANAMQSKCSMTSTMADELAELVARHASW